MRYKKVGRLRFLSHLEVLRSIERAIRRAGLPFALTQGFSPHMKIAYSAALPLGAESLDEYFDLQLTEFVDKDLALELLQKNSPEDLYPIDAAYIDPKSDSLTKALTISEYEMAVKAPHIEELKIRAALLSILERNYIELEKKGKIKQLELASRLYKNPSISKTVDGFTITLITRALDSGSLRPDSFLDALAAELLKDLGDLALCNRAKNFKAKDLNLAFRRFEVFDEVLIRRYAQYIEDENSNLSRGL